MGEYISCVIDVYPIRRPEENAQTKHQIILQTIQQAHSDLSSWNDNLPGELKLVNGVARERGVLWLHSLYNEVCIVFIEMMFSHLIRALLT